ncbi:DGQHR domain-containing protein [Paenibacillus sanguinis]|uniref:DGQHR domain-containing protein n=1 Tax=Paenibacillus sanguinis TaxID=225906 RepID=UPI000374C72E|nr:DGQHR domain-containing protein [Paenibacillus sanguinis]
MSNNIEPRNNLGAAARAKSKNYQTKTVQLAVLEKYLHEGWVIEKKNKASVRLKKAKESGILFEDRVWTLLFKMGFQFLSLDNGFTLINPKEPDTPGQLIDIVGIDNEIALGIVCKYSYKRTLDHQLQEEISNFSKIRERFSRYINKEFTSNHKRQIVFVEFLFNVSVPEELKDLAEKSNVILLDEKDLQYYENLVSHIGPASKYQFFADMIPGKRVPGLEIRVPAIKTKMGGTNCYTFSITPEYLLKISYISHRAKGKASDVNTYQRMISKSRLTTIKKYVSDNGIFPSNIVLNLDQKQVQFEKIGNDFNDKQSIENGILGWLIIRPTYKSAWIIDGQHRLYAYSGHEKASNSKLSILAFEGLPPSKQAELFIDINAKQKKVKQSLLEELYAELHWDAADPETRVSAIISKAVQDLGADPDSALHNRIQSADFPKDTIRCISLTSIFGELQKVGFHISKTKNGNVIEYGPLWAGDNDLTLKRTLYILKGWLNTIREGTRDWWDKGSAEGGGLAMNDGVITCIRVLKSVFQHLETKGCNLSKLNNKELIQMIMPYSQFLVDYLSSLTEEERKRFRDLRGSQGQTTRTRRCQQAIRDRESTFNPPGLDDFINLEKAQTNNKAKTIIDWIEVNMQKYVLQELQVELGGEETNWWINGIPQAVRVKVTERFEKDDGQRGKKEFYFDLMDYRKIILDNWQIFEDLFSYRKTGNKEAKTSWLVFVNEKRNAVAHSSSGVTLTLDELAQLEEYRNWLQHQFTGLEQEEIEEEIETLYS